MIPRTQIFNIIPKWTTDSLRPNSTTELSLLDQKKKKFSTSNAKCPTAKYVPKLHSRKHTQVEVGHTDEWQYKTLDEEDGLSSLKKYVEYFTWSKGTRCYRKQCVVAMTVIRKDFGVIMKQFDLEDGFEEEYEKLKMKRIYDDTQEDPSMEER